MQILHSPSPTQETRAILRGAHFFLCSLVQDLTAMLARLGT